MPKKWLTAAVDIGTTKICSCIGEVVGDRLKIAGTGWAPSNGLKKGVVVNLSETIQSVKSSLEKAESEANTEVESAVVSLGGRYLRSCNGQADTDIRGKGGRVAPEDIGRAVAQAQQSQVSEDSQIVHVLTQSFAVDDQDDILDPVGMSGSRLQVKFHLVCNLSAAIQNIVTAVNRAGVLVNSVVMQQLASAEAVLTPDEKELGSILIDVGGGTTDLAVYEQGSVQYSAVLPMGGSLITKDIAFGLRAPLQEAERLKIEMGSVYPDSVPEEEVVEIAEMGTGRVQTYARRLLCEIVEARCDEMLQSTAQVLTRSGIRPNRLSGVVLTGGGALTHGFVKRAQQILRMPVRLGTPLNVDCPNPEVLHPAYSTALGLIRYSANVRPTEVTRLVGTAAPSNPNGRTERLRNWIFELIG